MAGINEFLIFDENNQNTMTNQAYSTDDQRLNGVSTGIARSALYNKTMRQSSVMVNAIASYMANKNIDAREDSTLIQAVASLFSAKNINSDSGSDLQTIIDNMNTVVNSTFVYKNIFSKSFNVDVTIDDTSGSSGGYQYYLFDELINEQKYKDSLGVVVKFSGSIEALENNTEELLVRGAGLMQRSIYYNYLNPIKDFTAFYPNIGRSFYGSSTSGENRNLFINTYQANINNNMVINECFMNNKTKTSLHIYNPYYDITIRANGSVNIYAIELNL